MSDSAPRKDVEDVLSSVRRLVSSELPRNRRPDLPKGPGALVLTDAQRVEKPASKGRGLKSLEDRIAELEAAVSSREDDYEPDGSEDQAQHRPDRIVYTRPPSDAEEAEARGNALRLSGLSVVVSRDETPEEPEELPEGDAAPVAFRHTRARPIDDMPGDTSSAEEAPMAEDVAESPPAKAEVRPFHDPDDMVGRFEARIDGAELGPAPGPGHNGFSERLEPYTATVPAEEVAGSAEETPTIEDVLADDTEDEEFEAALSEAATKPGESVPRNAAPQPEGSVAEEPQTAKAKVAPVLSEAALDALDEEALRPIVAKLIREELQGELGERITRNVRKLVRREILRAINSQEFE